MQNAKRTQKQNMQEMQEETTKPDCHLEGPWIGDEKERARLVPVLGGIPLSLCRYQLTKISFSLFHALYALYPDVVQKAPPKTFALLTVETPARHTRPYERHMRSLPQCDGGNILQGGLRAALLGVRHAGAHLSARDRAVPDLKR
jgi:hypothetical protein